MPRRGSLQARRGTVLLGAGAVLAGLDERTFQREHVVGALKARRWVAWTVPRMHMTSAGLPDIILHGTATWALAGREILRLYAGSDPRRLLRLHGRFRAMVLPGTDIRLEHARGAGGTVSFTVRNHRGEPAIDQGFAILQ